MFSYPGFKSCCKGEGLKSSYMDKHMSNTDIENFQMQGSR